MTIRLNGDASLGGFVTIYAHASFTNQELVPAPGAGKRIKLTGFQLSSDVAGRLTLSEGNVAAGTVLWSGTVSAAIPHELSDCDIVLMEDAALVLNHTGTPGTVEGWVEFQVIE